MTNRKIFLLLLLILIIASFFRLYQITTTPPGLYPDEAMNGNNALQALRTGDFKVFYPENNGREGLFINIQALFLKIFGVNEPWVLRLPSAIFGTLTVLGIYFLTKELFDVKISFSPKPPQSSGRGSQSQVKAARRGRVNESQDKRSELRKNEILALLSAFFLATSFWHINFSRIGFRAILAPFFLTWALYFLLIALKKIKESDKFSVPGFWSLASGLFYGLGFYTYIAYRVTPLLLLVFLPFFGKKKGFWKVVAVFAATAFVVALPIGIYFLQHPTDFFGRTSEISIFASPTPLKDFSLNVLKTLGMFNFAGDWNWRHNYAGSPELFWPVGIMFLVGIAIGIRKLSESRMRNFEFGILFSWFILAMLPVVISNEGIPHALRSILILPPAIILAAVAGAEAYEWLKNNLSLYLAKVAVVILGAFIVASVYYTYFVAWANNPNVKAAFAADYVEMGRKINEIINKSPSPGDHIPIYVAVFANGVLVNGIPMPTQTVMFITDTYTKEEQNAKRVYYVPAAEEKSIPSFTYRFNLQ